MSGKLKTGMAALALLLALGLAAQRAQSDDVAKEMREPTQDEQMAMMQEWVKLMEPSQGHKRLEPLVGEWVSESKMWWGGPGSEPMVTKGTCKREWILGGRYLMENVKTEMMMPDMATGKMTSVPFEGMGISGYDNFRNMYFGTWVDSMGTQLLNFKGSCDQSGKVFTYYGEMDEPTLKIVGRLVKYVMRIVDNDKHVFAMYDLHVGDDYKVMEITYTRKK
ncbi:MAG: DUF1579 domain-containing protein [Phycisphaerales bacterium]|nr:DUF1579 domain-containing protein [Phycisphaerales bacterium]